MNTINHFDLDRLKPFIEEIIKKLEGGEKRLSSDGGSFKNRWLKQFGTPDFSDREESNRGIYSNHYSFSKDIEDDYFKEISIIKEHISNPDILLLLLGDLEKPIDLEDPAEKLMLNLKIKSFAMQIWDWYAIPWRHKDNEVYVIFSPRDMLGNPIIHTYSIDSFLSLSKTVIENQVKLEYDMEKKLRFWKNLALSFLFIIYFSLYFIIL